MTAKLAAIEPVEHPDYWADPELTYAEKRCLKLSGENQELRVKIADLKREIERLKTNNKSTDL